MTYSWETRELEGIMEEALNRDLDLPQAEIRKARYILARNRLMTDLLPYIRKQQGDLTDHGPEHIKDVIDSAQELLGTTTHETKKLNGVELYCLLLSILFHDVGNIENRNEHQKQVSQIYDEVFPHASSHHDTEEKRIILAICEAHCGKAPDGSANTILYVPEHSKLDRKSVNPIFLASVLRFADELSEGEHRTSSYMINHHHFSKESLPFHRYSHCCSIDIDRDNERVSLSYHIHINPPGKSNSGPNNNAFVHLEELEVFLNFIYHRIEKLHQERQYAKHYCNLLEPFKRTTVTIGFWYRGVELHTELQQVELTDLIVPGDPLRSFSDIHPDYHAERIVKLLEDMVNNFDR